MSNRLAREASPYLLQHADNPVDWYPWGPEALELARSEGKPILLSIGYSACHWCHVMAHESFEEARIAELMNRGFVNIKVDREERPDLDRIYQLAHQVIVQRPGGWPLTMFLTPDQLPFFGGTYFPPEARHGLPGFPDILVRVAQYWAENREQITEQSEALGTFFRDLEGRDDETPQALDHAAAGAIREQLEQHFDDRFGGFGRAPKFPAPGSLRRLLRTWHDSAHLEEPDLHALYMATLTLRRMAEGGLNDQLGGGFFRYSVDDYWMVPHFEKMLSDNAQLLGLYAATCRATGDEAWATVAAETAGWALREMQSPEGGFFASLDADGEDGEGSYYLWDREAALSLLGDDADLFSARYGLDRPPNLEGRWHLHGYRGIEQLAEGSGMTSSDVRTRLDAARGRLLAAREARVLPGRDEKVLVSWNGLMIQGLADAARYLERPELLVAARHAIDFIADRLVRDGRLHTAWKDGAAHAPATLDDHAFLLAGLMSALEAGWRDRDLRLAVELAEMMLDRFQDQDRGGFYFTAHDHEPLIHRPVPMADDATPSGNAVAAQALSALGHLLGESRYLEAAHTTLLRGRAEALRVPQAHATLIEAMETELVGRETVVIRGGEAELAGWHAAIAPWYAPHRQVFAIPEDAELPASLAVREPGPVTRAYVCEGMRCSAPVENLEALARLLSRSGDA